MCVDDELMRKEGQHGVLGQKRMFYGRLAIGVARWTSRSYSYFSFKKKGQYFVPADEKNSDSE